MKILNIAHKNKWIKNDVKNQHFIILLAMKRKLMLKLNACLMLDFMKQWFWFHHINEINIIIKYVFNE